MTIESQFVTAFIQLEGYSPLNLYCQLTGKPIGTLSQDEVDSLLEDIGSYDMVDLVGDYSIRLLASCRPSIRWNKMREETIDQMRTRAPVETFAYLLNRLLATPESKRQSFEDRLADIADRIRMFDHLTTLDSGTVTRCLNMLIELDALTGLDSIVCEISRDSFSEAALTKLHATEMKLHAQRVKHAKEQNNWVAAGCPLSRQAYANIVRENAPPTKAAIAVAEKRAESRFFENLFEELSTVAPSAPTPKPIKVVLPVMKLGNLKLNIAKKD